MEASRDDQVSLQLELEVGSAPISGHLVVADGSAHEFVGWLSLAAALERLSDPSAAENRDTLAT